MLQNQQMTQLDVKEYSVYEFLVSHIYVAKQNHNYATTYTNQNESFFLGIISNETIQSFSMAKFGFLVTIL